MLSRCFPENGGNSSSAAVGGILSSPDSTAFFRISYLHRGQRKPVGDDGCRVSRPVEGDYVFRSDILARCWKAAQEKSAGADLIRPSERL